ncbi:MAG: PrsW family intramembrane metalloprotease [Candidatus Moranbacteria bacterium]|nr:PrsW family intramembrane metalloprotease [Candidatus Moranbacteria bacterium]
MPIEQIAIIVVLYILTLILPTCFWFLFFAYQDRKEPEPKSLIAYLFLWGILTGFIAIIINRLIEYYLFNSDINSAHQYLFEQDQNISARQFITFLAVTSLFEEFVKLLAILYFTYKNKYFTQIIDGVIYATTIALGFSFFENSIYFFEFSQYLSYKEFFITSALRGIASVLLHLSATGIIGYFIGLMKFKNKNKPLYLAIGLICGMLLHIFFNLFIQLKYPLNSISFTLLALCFLLLFISIQRKKALKIWN